MKKRRFSRSVRFLLFVPILVILLLAASGTPGPVQAREQDDQFACWASGPLSNSWDGDEWGDTTDEFVADWRDLRSDSRYTVDMNPEDLEGPHYLGESGFSQPVDLSDADLLKWSKDLEVYTLFNSLPELVDYVFALDVFDRFSDFEDRSIYDRRVRLFATKLGVALPP